MKLAIFSIITFMISVIAHADQHKTLNPRGLMCERIEFTELNTYSPDELEQLYCSYDQAYKTSEQVNQKMMDKYSSDPRMSMYLLKSQLAELKKCTDPQFQVKDLLERKSPDFKIECSKYSIAKP